MTSTLDPVRQIAYSVLYEGYLLWPYRRSAPNSQQRWAFGGVFPQPYSTDRSADDPWQMQTQCLLEASPETTVDVEVRFLHMVRREVARLYGDRLERVPALTASGQERLACEEATEREVAAAGLAVESLQRRPRRLNIEVRAGEHTEWRVGHCGRRIGAVVRRWESLCGEVQIGAEPVQPGLVRLTVQVRNTTGWRGDDRQRALRRTFLSTHTVVRAQGGEFVSLLDPGPRLRTAAQECRNTGTWPVLVGEAGDRHTILSSPVILYDYPQVAPESPADLFDATEMDQLLTGNILAGPAQSR